MSDDFYDRITDDIHDAQDAEIAHLKLESFGRKLTIERLGKEVIGAQGKFAILRKALGLTHGANTAEAILAHALNAIAEIAALKERALTVEEVELLVEVIENDRVSGNGIMTSPQADAIRSKLTPITTEDSNDR